MSSTQPWLRVPLISGKSLVLMACSIEMSTPAPRYDGPTEGFFVEAPSSAALERKVAMSFR